MKYLFSLSTILIIASAAFAQGSTSVSFVPKEHPIDSILCYDLSIQHIGEDHIYLASQNYRFFYDAAQLRLLDSETKSELPDQYQFNVVQHTHGLDASGIGSLPYESTLAFVNASSLLTDSRAHTVLLNDPKGTAVAQFCFVRIGDQPVRMDFAREQLTASYGRAYVEISAADTSGEISALTIDHYIDIK